MTTTEVLLAVAIASGFVLLLLTLGAFIVQRPTAGVVSLVLAGVSFVLALVLMGHVSSDQQTLRREAVLEKYDVKIQDWGAPLGPAAEWKVDGELTECDVDLGDPDDPVVTCDGVELPRR